MTKLRLSDWASLAEIGGSLVVVAFLAYVGLEISQNIKAVHAATYQAFVGNLTQVDLAVVTDANPDRIISLGESSPAELSAQEWSTFSRYSLARVGQFELVHMSCSDGTMSKLQWSGIHPFYSINFVFTGIPSVFERELSDGVCPNVYRSHAK